MQHYTPPRNSPPRHVARPSPALGGAGLDLRRYTTRQHGTDWDVYRDDLAGRVHRDYGRDVALGVRIAADALPAAFVRVYMRSASGCADDLLVKIVLVPMNDNVPFCSSPRAVGSPLCENPS